MGGHGTGVIALHDEQHRSACTALHCLLQLAHVPRSPDGGGIGKQRQAMLDKRHRFDLHQHLVAVLTLQQEVEAAVAARHLAPQRPAAADAAHASRAQQLLGQAVGPQCLEADPCPWRLRRAHQDHGIARFPCGRGRHRAQPESGAWKEQLAQPPGIGQMGQNLRSIAK